MKQSQMAEQIVSEMERVTPYMYEGLYGSFLRKYMEADKSEWTSDLSTYLGNVNREWEDLSNEIATVLWERFEKRISC